MSIYILISFCLYFVIHFLFTQRIYSSNYFIIGLLFSLLIPAISFFQIDRTEWLKNVAALSLIFSFIILLFLIKIFYKRLNELLIQKRLIKKEYEGKDYTYIFWDSDINIEWWDKKLAGKPSWLDYSITFLLLILPILLTIPLSKLVK